MQNKETEFDDWMDFQAACEYVMYKPSWVYQLTAGRKIPHYKRGTKIFFRRSELRDWLLQGKRKTIKELEAETAQHLSR
jgi:excisionase family DNA binding protein